MKNKLSNPRSCWWGREEFKRCRTPPAVQFHKGTHFQPVVEVNQPAALQMELVCDADVGSSVGNSPILSLQAFVLQ